MAQQWSLVTAQTIDTPWTLMVTWATDINTDSSCSRAMDPDMPLGGSQSQDLTMVSSYLHCCGEQRLLFLRLSFQYCLLIPSSDEVLRRGHTMMNLLLVNGAEYLGILLYVGGNVHAL